MFSVAQWRYEPIITWSHTIMYGNDAVTVRHPSIWSFIRVLKDHQKLNEVTIQSIRNGDEAPIRRRKWRRLEQRINEKKSQYNSGEINIDQYWRAITHLILNIE